MIPAFSSFWDPDLEQNYIFHVLFLLFAAMVLWFEASLKSHCEIACQSPDLYACWVWTPAGGAATLVVLLSDWPSTNAAASHTVCSVVKLNTEYLMGLAVQWRYFMPLCAFIHIVGV